MKITISKTTEFEAVYLEVDAGVRYWEDAEVNGVKNIDLCESKGIGNPLMPCAVQIKEEADYNIYSDHYRWRPIIAIETGQIVNWTQGTTANVHYKVCDDFICDITDEDHIAIASYDGYVPKIMCPADEGYGDYIIMNIDENSHRIGNYLHLNDFAVNNLSTSLCIISKQLPRGKSGSKGSSPIFIRLRKTTLFPSFSNILLT